SLKTSIKTITYLSDIGCLEIQGASLDTSMRQTSTGLGYKVYLQGRITGFIYTVELHKHTSINNTN
ncbi:hypothetical protein KX748_23915, partial [Escherichia coli]|uniref:hypothetical protein n=1 Tax=Escherichia coli TaxID=562 RepID=UPI001C4E3943